MKRMFRGIMVLGLAALAMTSSARAEFNVLFFSEDPVANPGAVPLYTIDDDGPGDSSTPIAGVIGVSAPGDLSALNSAVSGTGLTFQGLTATTNAGSPPATGIAELLTSAELSGTGTIYILTSANDYNFPVTGPYLLDSTSSDTFTNVNAGTTTAFTSFFNDSNTLNGTETASSALVFAPPEGTTSQAGTAPSTVVFGDTPYGLTSVKRITLTGGSVGFNGATTIRTVPEPGSIALVLLGGSALLAGSLRRRKTV